MKNSFVRVDIVDNEADYGCDRVMDTYILVNPDMEKLRKLQEKIDARFDEENEFDGEYGAIYDYIAKNFEILKMEDFIEIEW